MHIEKILGGWPQLFFRILHDYSQRALHTMMGSPVHRMIIKSLNTPSKPFDRNKLSLFSVVKNEIFLLPAFLDHHRSIGIEQFVILVDHSDDGTIEYLLEQDDVVVLESSVKFGDHINVSPFSSLGITTLNRPEAWLKQAIMHEFFSGTHALYLDADEFLFLPPGISSVADVIGALKKTRAQAVSASVVEFFPENVNDLFVAGTVESLADLLARYPFFDNVPLLRPRPFRFPERIAIAKSGTLFMQYLETPDDGMTTLKTPIVRHSAFCFRRGSHRVSLPPTSKIVLTIAHFKFTSVSEDKFLEAANSELPYYQEMYGLLGQLLSKMHKHSLSFISADSTKYETSQQFIDTGLMLWPGEKGNN